LSALYNITKTGQGYIFITDTNLEYTVLFSTNLIKDRDGNNHVVYNFVFERSGKYDSAGFKNRFDEKVKNTIVHIVKEFFKLNGDTALLYFCYPEDEYSRQRSITFSKWHREELSNEIEHLKKNTIYNEEKLYGGMLYLKDNPLSELLIEAVTKYFDELVSYKD